LSFVLYIIKALAQFLNNSHDKICKMSFIFTQEAFVFVYIELTEPFSMLEFWLFPLGRQKAQSASLAAED
jgi:hypothetical protein